MREEVHLAALKMSRHYLFLHCIGYAKSARQASSSSFTPCFTLFSMHGVKEKKVARDVKLTSPSFQNETGWLGRPGIHWLPICEHHPTFPAGSAPLPRL